MTSEYMFWKIYSLMREERKEGRKEGGKDGRKEGGFWNVL